MHVGQGIVEDGVLYSGPGSIREGGVYKVVLSRAVVRRSVEATHWWQDASKIASIVYPERGQIVYTLSQLIEFQGWVQVVYYNEAVNIFVRGFVSVYSLALSVWSVPDSAPTIWTSPYVDNGMCRASQQRLKRVQPLSLSDDRVYEVQEFGAESVSDVQLICDCRVPTLDQGHSCCGACGSLMSRYLKQEVFLKCLWQVLGRETSIMLCDDHCVHRALGMARVLELMTCARVSYAGVGLHCCIRDCTGRGRRRLEWFCAYHVPPVTPLDVFESSHFSFAHSLSGAVYVDRRVSDRGRRCMWYAVPAHDGTYDVPLAGFVPPSWLSSEGAWVSPLNLNAMD